MQNTAFPEVGSETRTVPIGTLRRRRPDVFRKKVIVRGNRIAVAIVY